jgi:hypothetical protein
MKAAPAAHKNSIFILRSGAQRGVSKDVAAWFETHRFTALLTMRVVGMGN